MSTAAYIAFCIVAGLAAGAVTAAVQWRRMAIDALEEARLCLDLVGEAQAAAVQAQGAAALFHAALLQAENDLQFERIVREGME